MTGYVRVDTSNNIADGNVISAADLDNEFDGIQAAFNASTGHNHDGTTGEGAPISVLGPTQDVVVGASTVTPKTTNTVDIGSSSLKFKDLFLAGNASIGGTLGVTGATTLSSALTYGGVTLSNAVTGTGNMVLSASPTLTGTLSGANASLSGTLAVTGVATLTAQPILSSLTASQAVFTDGSKGLVSNAITGTGNVVMSASPTLTGTITAAALTTSSTVTLNGGTANGVAYLNGSKVLTTGSALTFSGGTLDNSGTAVIGIRHINTDATSNARVYATCGTSSGFLGQYGQSHATLPSVTSLVSTVGAITFNPSSTERMRISTAGGVSIGTTTDPGAGGLITTGNTTLGDATTDTVTVNGYMGVGGAGSSAAGIVVGSTALTGTAQRGVYSGPVSTSAATGSITSYWSVPATAAASFTTVYATGYWAADVTKGAGSTITNQSGLYVADQTQGTNNYGVFSGVSSGTNKWNIYASGTAANYFAGNVGIGTSSPTTKLTVSSSGANGIDISADTSSTTQSGRLFFSTGTAGQGWSMVNSSGIFRLAPAATAGSSTGSPVFDVSQAGLFRWSPDTVTAAMSLTAAGILLLGTTSASGSNLLQVNSDARINGLTVGKGLAGLSGNTAVGVSALAAVTTGNGNTAIGLQALDANTTGQNNVAIGANAAGANQTAQGLIAIGANALLQATAGDNNIAIGNSAISGVTTGGNNTVVGASALAANTSGAENTAIGYLASSNNTTGSNNTALGRRALWGNTTTTNNVAVGYFALDDVLTAGNSTAVGYNALGAATGGNNTALGYNAGAVATTGTSNLFLGTNSGAVVTTGGKNVIIGSYQGNSGGLDIRTASNYIVLSDGDANIRQVIDSSGNVGIGTSSPGTRLTVLDNSGTGTTRYRQIELANSVSSQKLYSGVVADTVGSYLQSNAFYDSSFQYNPVLTYSSGLAFDINGNISFRTNSGLTAGVLFTPTERMRIDSSGNVGIGTSSPSASAILDAQSTTKGVRMPNMTTAQKNAIASPAAGLMVFDTTLSKLCVYTGAAWETITSI